MRSLGSKKHTTEKAGAIIVQFNITVLSVSLLCAMGAVAQTVNKVPKYIGTTPSSALADSAITELNGNVGIGTTAPTATLTIRQDAGTGNPVSTPAAMLDFKAFYTGYDTETVKASIRSGVDGTAAWHTQSGFLSFHTANQGTLNEAMRINALGYVGIGTTVPTATLTVNAGSANINPSVTYGTPAAFSFQSASVELAQGVATTTPWAYWLQARQTQNVPWTLALNPLGGNVGIGTTNPGAKLDVSGNIKLSVAGTGIIFPDGTQTMPWTGSLCGGDYAESVGVNGDHNHYEPGDVLVIDPDSSDGFRKSTQPYSTGVSGIYSTKPGVVGRRSVDPDKIKEEIPMAMVGIVPTKVSAENGPIKRGDLLVTSSIAGYAMKGTDRALMFGAVVGKALNNFDSGTGVIDVLVTLQ